MLRVFTKDVGRYQRGDVRDYPSHVWTDMAVKVGQSLATFTADPSEHLEPQKPSLKTKKN